MNYLKLLWDLHSLKKNVYKSREQIKALQEKKLRRMLKYAFSHSPYYRVTFAKNGINDKNIDTAPLSQFPVTDKSILLRHFNEIVTAPDLSQENLRSFDENTALDKRAFKNKYHLVHSSGSTGKPAYFVYDNKAWNYMLVGMLRAALWNMSMTEILKYFLHTPRLLYIAATDGRYGGAMAIGDGIANVGAKQLFIDVNTPLEKWIEQINKFQPDMIIGYPSALKILGELCEDSKIHINAFRTISCGEPLSSNLRSYLADTLKTEIINFYGASESIVMGLEETPEDGMYLFDDMNYIEVENGTMYLTSLYNFIQPLIRYKISDNLTFKADGKKYPFSRAESIFGRNEDILWFNGKDGKKEFLHPLAIEGFCIDGLLDYQFIKIDDYAFEMIAQASSPKVEDNIHAEMMKKMKEILISNNLEHIQFYVRFADEITADPKTGKKKLVVNN